MAGMFLLLSSVFPSAIDIHKVEFMLEFVLSVGVSSGIWLTCVVSYPEGPGELGLREGDVVNNVEQVDSEWYRGSCRGSSGFFPVSYVKVMVRLQSMFQL